MHIVEVAEGIAGQVRAMIGNKTDVHHHVPWKLALDLETQHSLHRIARWWKVELDACSSQGRIAMRRQWEAIGRDRRLGERRFVRRCVAQRKNHTIPSEGSALIGVETLRVIQKYLPLGTLRDALADVVEAIGGVRVENIEAAA